jgi:hypothetical protein
VTQVEGDLAGAIRNVGHSFRCATIIAKLGPHETTSPLPCTRCELTVHYERLRELAGRMEQDYYGEYWAQELMKLAGTLAEPSKESEK